MNYFKKRLTEQSDDLKLEEANYLARLILQKENETR